MSDAPKRQRSEYFRYRVIVATVLSLGVAWLTLSILTSVGLRVYGAAEDKAQAVKRVKYVAGGDNARVHKRCAQGLRRLMSELRSRLSGVAAQPVGDGAHRRWQQWMDHYKQRLGAFRTRCHIGPGDTAANADPVLSELVAAAEGLAELAHSYERAHAHVMATFEEDFVALEGVFARAEARMVPHPR